MITFEKAAGWLLPALFLGAVAQACGGTVVFEEDGGDPDGDGGGNGVTVASSTALTAVTMGATSVVVSAVSTGGSVVAVSTGVTTGVTVGGLDCGSTNDGVCDEPGACPFGSDTADCAFAGEACAPVCVGDPGCGLRPPFPSDECLECVRDQANDLASCAINAAFSDTCQNDIDCSSYVDCVLAGGFECGDDNPQGYRVVLALLLQYCGSCGNGRIE